MGVDQEGRIQLANRQVEAVFGYRTADLIGRPLEALIPARLSGAHTSHRKAYFDNPRARAMGEGLELLGVRKDGTEFPVDVSLTTVATASGVLAVAFVRDITQRKVSEEQLRVANRDLESFSHTISHDLRAPLRAMRGFSQALLEDYAKTLDSTAADYLRRIDNAGASMERLVDDLLEYSRVGRREVKTRPVDLQEVVQEVLLSQRAAIEASGGKVDVVHPLPPVVAEPQLLGQALSNLVSNALKYTPPGTAPSVTISATARQGRVRLSVADHGIGIDDQHLKRIWKPFERLHGAEQYPGTGVGLAIVQRATERMGASVGVESVRGKGSVFWIELRPATEGSH